MIIMYFRSTVQWVDDSPCYHCNVSLKANFQQANTFIPDPVLFSLKQQFGFILLLNEFGRYYPVMQDQNLCAAFICESKQKTSSDFGSIELEIQTRKEYNPSIFSQTLLLQCSSGHVAYNFLSCGSTSMCESDKSLSTCLESESIVAQRSRKFHKARTSMSETETHRTYSSQSISSVIQISHSKSYLIQSSQSYFYETQSSYSESHHSKASHDNNELYTLTVDMFECTEISEFIHYTLLCDLTKDCIDATDETFCVHNYDILAFT